MLSELIIQSQLVTTSIYTVRYNVVNSAFCRQSVLVCSVELLKGTSSFFFKIPKSWYFSSKHQLLSDEPDIYC